MGYGQVTPDILGTNTLGRGRNWTARVWEGFDPAAMDRDPSIGFYQQDDFMGHFHIPANTAITATIANGYSALTTNNTGCQIVSLPGQGGIISLENAASSGDNDEAFLQANRAYVIASADEDDTLPYHHISKVVFGTRFALNSVSDNVNGIFIGLAGQALATGALATDTMALVSTFHGIGLQILAADGDAMNLVYQENGSALQTLISSAIVPVVNEWHTFEMVIDPWAPPTERGTFWFDGVKHSTFLTHAQMIASTFPISTDSVSIPLGPTWLHKAGSDAAAALYLGSWRAWSQVLKTQGNEACG